MSQTQVQQRSLFDELKASTYRCKMQYSVFFVVFEIHQYAFPTLPQTPYSRLGKTYPSSLLHPAPSASQISGPQSAGSFRPKYHPLEPRPDLRTLLYSLASVQLCHRLSCSYFYRLRWLMGVTYRRRDAGVHWYTRFLCTSRPPASCRSTSGRPVTGSRCRCSSRGRRHQTTTSQAATRH